MGTVITFYSYKGGVGRTFLMANVAWLLAEWRFRVLCIDWDLKAPGLSHYLVAKRPGNGLVELLLACAEGGKPDWRGHLAPVRGGLDLMPAGRRDEGYIERVQSLMGCIDVVQRAQKRRGGLPLDRGNLLTLPVPSRFDATEEYKLAQHWLGRFAEVLPPFYQAWQDQSSTVEDLMGLLRIPYFSFWSFGERLPVRDERLHDPQGISYYIAKH